jgi:hypothetical protein
MASSFQQHARRPGPQAQVRDQRRALHRRDAGAADYFHGDAAANNPSVGQPAERGEVGTKPPDDYIQVTLKPNGALSIGVKARPPTRRKPRPTAMRWCWRAA